MILLVAVIVVRWALLELYVLIVIQVIKVIIVISVLWDIIVVPHNVSLVQLLVDIVKNVVKVAFVMFAQ